MVSGRDQGAMIQCVLRPCNNSGEDALPPMGRTRPPPRLIRRESGGLPRASHAVDDRLEGGLLREATWTLRMEITIGAPGRNL